MKRIIFLQELGQINPIILKRLKKNLKWAFKDFIISIKLTSDIFNLDNSDYDPSRRQYNATIVLSKLAKQVKNKDYFRTLGIIDKDIYSNFLNFVFGVARIPNKDLKSFSGVSLISLTRLREEFYDRPEDDSLFELRILKEAIHELGHTFKLKHCNYDCIMQFSNSIKDTDNKPPKFCENCLNELTDFFKELN